jgi:hypothetical protein
MYQSRSVVPQVLLGLALVVSACVDGGPSDGSDDHDDGVTTSEATSELSSASWATNITTTADSWWGSQISALNGITYTVGAGSCGGGGCFAQQDKNNLHWESYSPTLGFGPHGLVPDQASGSKPSLTPFNGFLYMVHTGTSDGTTIWLSRYNPATQTWMPHVQTPYTSTGGPPAIVAYNNKLYFIGVNPYPYSMWYGTMSVDQVFSQPAPIPGHDSRSRPSATVLGNKLYFAHEWGQTGDIVYGTFNGTTWTPATHIPGGPNGATIRGFEPVLATDNGYIHLVHRRIGDSGNFVWWTYFDGCQWTPTEVTIGAIHSTREVSLAQGGPGLTLLIVGDDNDIFGLESHTETLSTWTRGAPSPCQIIVRPIDPHPIL